MLNFVQNNIEKNIKKEIQKLVPLNPPSVNGLSVFSGGNSPSKGRTKEILPSKVCPQCQKEIPFTPRHKRQVCCSRSCARKRFNSLNKIQYVQRTSVLPEQSELSYQKN